MISKEDVADLKPGDVVEIRDERWPEGTSLRGPVWTDGAMASSPCVGWFYLRKDANDHHSLTVVSRAPRPLYVNHPRTEAKEHDVVRDGHGVIRHHGPVSDSTDPTWWSWEVEPGFRWTWTSTPPQPLTLLVDGETGQVVQ